MDSQGVKTETIPKVDISEHFGIELAKKPKQRAKTYSIIIQEIISRELNHYDFENDDYVDFYGAIRKQMNDNPEIVMKVLHERKIIPKPGDVFEMVDRENTTMTPWVFTQFFIYDFEDKHMFVNVDYVDEEYSIIPKRFCIFSERFDQNSLQDIACCFKRHYFPVSKVFEAFINKQIFTKFEGCFLSRTICNYDGKNYYIIGGYKSTNNDVMYIQLLGDKYHENNDIVDDLHDIFADLYETNKKYSTFMTQLQQFIKLIKPKLQITDICKSSKKCFDIIVLNLICITYWDTN